ncbi:MAG: hypothetical protein AAGJ46_06940 [Planctomycetota bacterium]
MRIGLIAAPVLVSMLAPAASAGLVSTAELSVAAAATVSPPITLLRLPTAPLWGSPPDEIPEGAVFVDLVASTRGRAVFRGRPSLSYNPGNGDLVVEAPPMFGPADEFGQRWMFSPARVYLMFGDHLGTTPEMPALTYYARDLTNPTDATRSSFQAGDPTGFDMEMRRDYVEIDPLAGGEQSGLRVVLRGWLTPGLGRGAFETPVEVDPPAVSLTSLSTDQPGFSLPEVSVLVQYSGNSFYGLNFVYLGRSGSLFLAEPVSVPAPHTVPLAGLAVAALACRRWRR